MMQYFVILVKFYIGNLKKQVDEEDMQKFLRLKTVDIASKPDGEHMG